jgi:TrmH family RNA methyltransferase
MLGVREARERRATGLFLAEGEREVTRALEAGLVIDSLWLCPELAGAGETLVLSAMDGRAPAYELSEPLMRAACYRENPRGPLAVFSQPRWEPSALPRDPRGLWLFCVGSDKPGNLGAMARSASAAGAAALVAVDTAIDPFNPNALRASTGAVFTLPVLAMTTPQAMEFARERGIRLFPAMLDAQRPHSQAPWRSPCGPAAVVVGAEDRGLDPQWAGHAQASGGEAVRIAMAPGAVDSLNASVAAAVLLFEARRQQGETGTP